MKKKIFSKSKMKGLDNYVQITPDNQRTGSFEKVPTRIFDNNKLIAEAVAYEIASLIRAKQKLNEPAVLGLATGSTPITVYAELVRMHREEGLSFKNVITFNLDEYYPMSPSSRQSFVHFMNERLFDHVDIPRENIYIPDGMLKREEISDYCAAYDRKIEQVGGIDIQILGIGRTGHIGFNEPGSELNSPTRLIAIDYVTITDAASNFHGEEHVPTRAITMGVSTILKSKRIILIALGEGKANVIQRTVEGEISSEVPATFLQHHDNTIVVLDQASASELTRVKTPWLTDICDWKDPRLMRRAVVWLCQKLEKPILKLTDRDYRAHGMGDLIAERGPSNKINIDVFNGLQKIITGWPGGKPNADDSSRPERALPYPKRVVVFSPHPDDDVISMGGTLSRLVEQGHEVHVVYQTSGAVAVHDDDVIRYIDFAAHFNDRNQFDHKDSSQLFKQIKSDLAKKKPGDADTEAVRNVKLLIRQGEAEAACRFLNIPRQNAHFLEMPFYDTGRAAKKPLSDQDIELLTDLLTKVQPHQIYAAGDLSDPHGTHRVCLEAVFRALDQLQNEPWMLDCRVWLYRGAWQEWDMGDIDMAVPISPDELVVKRKAIFKHQSQKDKALFPGSDEREFWQRSEDRNRATARLYNLVGMAEYEAIEAFVRWK